jgi:hypothetical protein
MIHRRNGGRRARARAAALALAAAVALGACGQKQVPAEEYDPDAPPPAGAARSAPAAQAPPAAPGAPPAAPMLTPEQDSAQEAEAFARRQQSMESYESCVAKIRGIEEPVRSTLMEACGRSRKRN